MGAKQCHGRTLKGADIPRFPVLPVFAGFLVTINQGKWKRHRHDIAVSGYVTTYSVPNVWVVARGGYAVGATIGVLGTCTDI